MILRSILLSLVFIVTQQTLKAEIMTYPDINIKTAIDLAQQFAEVNEIDLTDRFIVSARYDRDQLNQYRRPYWSVTWAVKTVSKGGDVEIRIYSDKSIKVFYYK